MIGKDLDTFRGIPKLQAAVYEHEFVARKSPYGLLQFVGENFWNVYRLAAASYTLRQLTNPHDILPAFEWLSHRMRKEASIDFWYNLPTCTFDQSLLWYSEQPLTRRRYHDQDPHASWSWARWKDAIKYRGRGWYSGLYRGPVSAVKWLQKLEPSK